MDTTPTLRILLLFLSAILVTPLIGCGALKLLDMRIPAAAEWMQPAALSCSYDAEGDQLYAVKWYKDRHEFFRYQPTSQPKFRAFPVKGFTVDTGHSNDTTVYLQNVTLEAAGHYMCEVSMDAPAFNTMVKSSLMNVIASPPEGPRIHGLQDSYIPGQPIVANCSVGPSFPQAEIRWTVNGLEVDRGLLTFSRRQDTGGFQGSDGSSTGTPRLRTHFPPYTSPSWVAVHLVADPGLFEANHGHLQLSCTASVSQKQLKPASASANLRTASGASPSPPGNQRLSQQGRVGSGTSTTARSVTLWVMLLILTMTGRADL